MEVFINSINDLFVGSALIGWDAVTERLVVTSPIKRIDMVKGGADVLTSEGVTYKARTRVYPESTVWASTAVTKRRVVEA